MDTVSNDAPLEERRHAVDERGAAEYLEDDFPELVSARQMMG